MKRISSAALILAISLCAAAPAAADDTALFKDYKKVFTDYQTAIDTQQESDQICYIADISSPEAIGFAFMDLNGDGISELLTGKMPEDEISAESPVIYDVYSLVDGSPVLLKSSWLRGRLFLAKEGRIYVSYPMEADYYMDLYEVESGSEEMRLYKSAFSFQETSCTLVTTDGGVSSQEKVSTTSDKFNQFIDETAPEKIELRPFTEWYQVKDTI